MTSVYILTVSANMELFCIQHQMIQILIAFRHIYIRLHD